MDYFYYELKNRIELRVTISQTEAVTVDITPPALPEARALTLATCADILNEQERARFKDELTAGLSMLASFAQTKDVYATIINRVSQNELEF